MNTTPPPSLEQRTQDTRIPPIGSVPPAERMFRVNWIANEWREGGRPFVSADFVARQGKHVRLLDVRPEAEMPGSLGYVSGADWVPLDELEPVLGRLGQDDPVVLISRSGYRAAEYARELIERRGMRFVAAMHGGLWSWRDLGFATSHDLAILGRRGKLREIEPPRWDARKGELSLEEVQQHLGDPHATRWFKLAALLVHGRTSCVDGRDATGVLGTPGGDAGEFILALAAIEGVSGGTLATAQIQELLRRRIEAFGRFYIHTDLQAGNTMIQALRADPRIDEGHKRQREALEWRHFFRSPPVDLRSVLLEHATEPAHLGCGHLRLMLQNPALYGVRPELVLDVLRTIFERQWAGEMDIEVSVLPGGHSEGGVLSVVLEDGVAASSWIPLVSPSAGGSQMFVTHPQVAAFLRAEQCQFLARQRDVLDLGVGAATDLPRVFAELGARQAGATLGALAKGLPIFEARFARERLVSVRSVGRVLPPPGRLAAQEGPGRGARAGDAASQGGGVNHTPLDAGGPPRQDRGWSMAHEVGVGQLVAGKYLVERVLGEGGMGLVVQARHAQLAQRVAIKVMLPSALGSAEAQARFLREARAAAALTSEHVVRVFDVGVLPSGALFMVMEHLEGHDLAQAAGRGPLPVAEAIDFIEQACVGLSEAHAAGIVHRDLKPQNLFLARQADGSVRLKILDFGVAKAPTPAGGRITRVDASYAPSPHAQLTAAAGALGTPHYMAPEQFESAHSVDARADVWSLGVILYQLLAGHRPFEADSFEGLFVRIASGPPAPLRSLRPDVPPALEAIVHGCLALDPARRPQSAGQLAAALVPFGSPWSLALAQRAARQLGEAPPLPPAAPAPASPLSPWKVALATLLALVAAGAALLVVLVAGLVSSCSGCMQGPTIEGRMPLPPGDMSSVDLLTLLPQARTLAAQIEPGARLASIRAGSTNAGAVDVARGHSIGYTFEYGPTVSGGRRREGLIRIQADDDGFIATRIKTESKRVDLPDPRCGSKEAYKAAIAAGLQPSRWVLSLLYEADANQRPHWLLNVSGMTYEIDPTTCAVSATRGLNADSPHPSASHR